MPKHVRMFNLVCMIYILLCAFIGKYNWLLNEYIL